MAVSVVQSVGAASAGRVTSLATTIASSGAGHALVIAVGQSVNETVTITDNLGSTYVAAVADTTDSTNVQLAVYYLANCPAGVTSLTATVASLSDLVTWVWELSGAPTSSPLDGTPPTATSGGSRSTAPSVSATTLTANDLILGALAWYSTATLSAISASWTQGTLETAGSAINLVGFSQQAPTVGTYTLSGTLSASEYFVATIVPVLEASGGTVTGTASVPLGPLAAAATGSVPHVQLGPLTVSAVGVVTSGASVSFSPVVATSSDWAASGSETVALTGVASGQPIVVAIGIDGAETVTGIADTFATPYTWEQVVLSDNGLSAAIWIGTGGSGTSGSVTVTLSDANSGFQFTCYCAVGASTAAGLAAIDASNIANGSTTTTLTIPSVVPTVPGDGAVVAFGTHGSTITWPTQAGWTFTSWDYAGSPTAGSAEVTGLTVGTAPNATVTMAAAGLWETAAALLKAGGSAPPTVTGTAAVPLGGLSLAATSQRTTFATASVAVAALNVAASGGVPGAAAWVPDGWLGDPNSSPLWPAAPPAPSGTTLALSASGQTSAQGSASPALKPALAASGSSSAQGSAQISSAATTAHLAASGQASSDSTSALSLDVAAHASGEAQSQGTARGQLAEALKASGQADSQGVAEASLAAHLAASGKTQAQGAAKVTALVHLEASGESKSQGSAEASTSAQAALRASGEVAAHGSAAPAFVLELSACGSGAVKGSARASIAAALTAAGQAQSLGSAVATLRSSVGAYDAAVLALGPAGYWKLADASGSPTVADASGNGYIGTLGTTGVALGATPGAIQSEPNETALATTGADYVATSAAPQSSVTAWSIAAWFKTTSATEGMVIAGDRGTAGSGISLTLSMGATYPGGAGVAGDLAFGVDSNALYAGEYTSTTFNDGKWHFVVATWTAPSGTAVAAGQFQIYVDNVLQSTTFTNVSGTSSPLTGSGGERLGDNGMALAPAASGQWNFWDGDLAQVALFDFVLSATQVTDLWNAASTTSVALAASGQVKARAVTSPTLKLELSASGGVASKGSARVELASALKASGQATSQATAQIGAGSTAHLLASGYASSQSSASATVALAAKASGQSNTQSSAQLTTATRAALSASGEANAQGSAVGKLALKAQAAGEASSQGSARLSTAAQAALAASGQSKAQGSVAGKLALEARTSGQARAEGTAQPTIAPHLAASGQASSQGSAAITVKAAPVSYDTAVLALGPKAYWKLADAVGSATVVDSSGDGFTGTVNGTVTLGEPGLVPSETDTAALFDGSTGYITTSPLGSMAKWTIAAWAKPSADQTSDAAIATDVYSTQVNYALFTGTDSTIPGTGPLTVTAGFYDGAWNVAPPYTMTVGSKYFLVGTYDGSTITLYVNGVSVGTTSVSATPASDGVGFRIGRRWDIGDYFAGDEAQVAIFDFALTSTNVTDLWNASQGEAALALSASGQTQEHGTSALGLTLGARSSGEAISAGSAQAATRVELAASGSASSQGTARLGEREQETRVSGQTSSQGSAQLSATASLKTSGETLSEGSSTPSIRLQLSAHGQASSQGSAQPRFGTYANLQASGSAKGQGTASQSAKVALASHGQAHAQGVARGTLAAHLASSGQAKVEGSAQATTSEHLQLSAGGVTHSQGSVQSTAKVGLASSGESHGQASAKASLSAKLVASGEVTAQGSAQPTVGSRLELSASGSNRAQGSALLSATIAVLASGASASQSAAILGLAQELTAHGSTQSQGKASLRLAMALLAAGQAKGQGSARISVSEFAYLLAVTVYCWDGTFKPKVFTGEVEAGAYDGTLDVDVFTGDPVRAYVWDGVVKDPVG